MCDLPVTCPHIHLASTHFNPSLIFCVLNFPDFINLQKFLPHHWSNAKPSIPTLWHVLLIFHIIKFWTKSSLFAFYFGSTFSIFHFKHWHRYICLHFYLDMFPVLLYILELLVLDQHMPSSASSWCLCLVICIFISLLPITHLRNYWYPVNKWLSISFIHNQNSFYVCKIFTFLPLFFLNCIWFHLNR